MLSIFLIFSIFIVSQRNLTGHFLTFSSEDNSFKILSLPDFSSVLFEFFVHKSRFFKPKILTNLKLTLASAGKKIKN